MVPGLRGVPVGGGGDSDSESDVEDGGPEVPETQLMAENGPLLEQAREEPVQVSQVGRLWKCCHSFFSS